MPLYEMFGSLVQQYGMSALLLILGCLVRPLLEFFAFPSHSFSDLVIMFYFLHREETIYESFTV